MVFKVIWLLYFLIELHLTNVIYFVFYGKNIGNKVLTLQKNSSLHRKTFHSNITWWNPEMEISFCVNTAEWLSGNYAVSMYLMIVKKW